MADSSGRVRAVASGRRPGRSSPLYRPADPTPTSPFPELTEREREILSLIGGGLDNATIAGRLYLSPKTVRNHVSNILSKLQVSDRVQAALRAREAGLGHDEA